MSERANKWAERASKAEQANEWAVRANKQTDEQVAQYLRPDSWLFWTNVLSPTVLPLATTTIKPIFRFPMTLPRPSNVSLSTYTIAIGNREPLLRYGITPNLPRAQFSIFPRPYLDHRTWLCRHLRQTWLHRWPDASIRSKSRIESWTRRQKA